MTTSSRPVPRAVVAGHAGFAAGVVSAAVRISGRTDSFVAVSNEGLDLRGLEEAIRAALKAHGATVIFTDLPAGSCTMAARRIQRDQPGVAVVTGVNLATLLDFAFHTEAGDEHAVEHAADKGRAALVVTGGPRGA